MRPLEKRSTPITPSSSALAPHAAARDHRADALRLVVEHEAQGVGVVHGDVERDAAARLGLVDAPALQIGRQIDRMKHPREQRPADAPLFDRLAHRAMRRGVAQVVVDAHDDAAFAAGGDHRARVGEVQRQRLLAQDMLAGAGGGEQLIAVQIVGGRDIDGVDPGSATNAARSVARARDAMRGGEGPRRVRVWRSSRRRLRRHWRESRRSCAGRAIVLAPIRPHRRAWLMRLSCLATRRRSFRARPAALRPRTRARRDLRGG